jgi:hypothetical protein
LLHYSHQRCCSISAHGPTLRDGEGVENFWPRSSRAQTLTLSKLSG